MIFELIEISEQVNWKELYHDGIAVMSLCFIITVTFGVSMVVAYNVAKFGSNND